MNDIEYWIIWLGLVSPWVLICIYSIYSLIKRIWGKENK